jgi:hydrogenase maturation factor
MPGIRIAALYSIYPCELGLCGPESANKVLSDYLLNNVSEDKARQALEQFKGAYPYYKVIARANNIEDALDEKVVKAYWIGNELLDKVSADSLKDMIVKEFSGLLSEQVIQEKIKQVSSESKPHHSFHVFTVGSVTGTIKLEPEILDICRVSWGEVIRKGKDRAVVRYGSVEKTVLWDKSLVSVEIGDMVSIHWNHIIQVLNKEDLLNLKKYTQCLKSLK